MNNQKTVQRAFCTTREAAELLGISLRTAQLWVESGVLTAWKTEGGHRRISRASINKLLEGNHPALGQGDGADGERQAFTILVAEDEPDLLRVYEINMTRWPMRPRVITARDGYQALVLLGREKPDMMVSDLHMPSMDGFQMLRTLRAMPEAADTAIVVVTGLDRAEIESRGGVPAGIPILAKPIPFAHLLRIAMEFAERKTARVKVAG